MLSVHVAATPSDARDTNVGFGTAGHSKAVQKTTNKHAQARHALLRLQQRDLCKPHMCLTTVGELPTTLATSFTLTTYHICLRLAQARQRALATSLTLDALPGRSALCPTHVMLASKLGICLGQLPRARVRHRLCTAFAFQYLLIPRIRTLCICGNLAINNTTTAMRFNARGCCL